MRVVPRKGRATLDETPNGLVVLIPSKKKWYLVVFLLAWLGGWTVGETSAISSLLKSGTKSGSDAFMIFWLVGWTIGGGFALLLLGWMVAGKERIRLSPTEIQIRREIFGYGVGREFDLQHVTNLRAVPTVSAPYGMNGMEFWGFSGGSIAFDYGAKTERFAAAIDEAEARAITERLLSTHRFKGSAA